MEEPRVQATLVQLVELHHLQEVEEFRLSLVKRVRDGATVIVAQLGKDLRPGIIQGDVTVTQKRANL